MAKRLTDTEKWKKAWFRCLSPTHKAFWEYLRDNCDHAGVWEVDFELAQFQINGVLNQDGLFEIFKNHVVIINSNKWFLIDFIPFQYSCTIEQLNPKNKLHKSVLALLEKHKINKGLASSLKGAKNKNKVKNKDKEGKGLASPLVGAKEFNPIDIIPFFNDKDFQLAWEDHIKTRKKKKGSLEQRADKHILNELLSLSNGSKNLAILLLDQSARKGWIDVFPLKEKPIITRKPIGYRYLCPSCENMTVEREFRPVDQFDNYTCKVVECPKVQLVNKEMIGSTLMYIEKVYKDES